MTSVTSTTNLAHAHAIPWSGAPGDLLAASYAALERLRHASGLYVASPSADYGKAWIRDNVYEVLPYADKPTRHYEQTLHALLDVVRRHEWKVDAIIREKPTSADAYIHARFDADAFTEINEPWGNKQNDATGLLLFGIAEGMRHGKKILRDERDARLVKKLVRMLRALEYWQDADNGMWEEAEELHASSVGACVGGLLAIREVGFDVDDDLIEKGRQTLRDLLPREGPSKRVDLALLSLGYPYRGVVTDDQLRAILHNVERHLLRERGVIRYEGDSYYSPLANEHGRDKPRSFYHGTEAEWTFGLPWLSLLHRKLGHIDKANEYLAWTSRVQNAPGELPELYYAGSSEAGPNTPLGWSIAMHILALEAAGTR